MPSFVCRYAKDDPRYFIWSTVVDAPTTGLLTKEEMILHLLVRYGTDNKPEERIARADDKGSSCLFGEDMYWDDIVLMQDVEDGFVTGPRSALRIEGDEYWLDEYEIVEMGE